MSGKMTIENLKDQFDVISREPISDGTKRIRRNLVVTSIIAILVELANVKPTKIATLGIEEIPPDIVPILVGFMTWYFLLALFLHSNKDFRVASQRIWFSNAVTAFANDALAENEVLDAEVAEIKRRIEEGSCDDNDRQRLDEIGGANKRVQKALEGSEAMQSTIRWLKASQAYDHFGAAILGLFAAAVTIPTLWTWAKSVFNWF